MNSYLQKMKKKHLRRNLIWTWIQKNENAPKVIAVAAAVQAAVLPIAKPMKRNPRRLR